MPVGDYIKKASLIWFSRAQEDINWAEYNLKGGFFMQVCFICQQAVEKALKSYLRGKGLKIEGKLKIHDLALLGKECQKFDRQFAEIGNELKILSQYYAPTRYPEILGLLEYKKETAESALGLARKILNFVAKKIREVGLLDELVGSGTVGD